MKKFFTLIFATMLASSMSAQMHGALKFSGASEMAVMGQNTPCESDTVKFEMVSMSAGNITLPAMEGMATIPSFTIENVTFTMGENHVITMADQTFSAKVTVNNEEKSIIGSSLTGTYNMADNSFTLKVVFQYGKMPFPLTYSIKSYYIKEVSSPIAVSIGGMMNYENAGVTYQVRKYMDGETQKMDVTVPTYTLDNTVMGNMTLGTYTIKGLTYDEAKGGFYRDYKNDGLKFHVVCEGGSMNMDNDYSFNAEKDNNILVKYEGSKVSDIINRFQMGAMPFYISTNFKAVTNGIGAVKGETAKGKEKMYNLQGQLVGDNYKGVVIINGKKFLKK